MRAIPSRTLLRGHPARNAGGTLLPQPLLVAVQSSRLRSSFYSTVAAEEAVPRRKKVWDSVDEAIQDVKSGDVVLSAGACSLLRFGVVLWGTEEGTAIGK